MENRYHRQTMLPEIGEEGQRRLADAKVLVVGAGGLGSPITLYLAGAGVGTLALMDDDVVSLTNLHRQVLYGEDVLGMPKAVCATERLQSLNSDVHIITYPERLTPQNAAERIAAYDIVVDGTDNAAVRYLISDVCQALRKPYVYGAICGFEGQVAVLCAGHATYRTLYPQDDAPASSLPVVKGVVGPTPGTVGSVEAAQAIQLLCGMGSPLIDRLWTIDLRTMKSFVIDL